MGASYLIGQLTAGQDVKIIKDLGLAATSIFGLFIAVFIGIGLVSKEVERRSIYCAARQADSTARSSCSASTPGSSLTLAVNLAIMAAALYAVLAYMAWGVPTRRRSGVGSAGARSGAAQGDRPDLRRADARHRHRAVLLDLLDADAVGGADLRLCSSPATSAPTCGISTRSSIRRRRRGWRAASTGCCRTSRRSTCKARSSTASRCRPAIWR